MELQHPLSYGINDICGSIFFQTQCTGERDDTEDPILACSLSSVTLRKTVDAGTAQEPPNLSATTGKRCLERDAVATRDSRFLDFVTCGLETPKLWANLRLEAPVLDPVTGEIIGFEDISDDAATCESCGIATGACTHQNAFATIHNAWCGDDRHPRFPYVVNIYPSGETQLVENDVEYSAGFSSFRSFTMKLKSNPNFLDPWGLMVDGTGQPSGTSSVYHQRLVTADVGSQIEALINNSCACIFCGDN